MQDDYRQRGVVVPAAEVEGGYVLGVFLAGVAGVGGVLVDVEGIVGEEAQGYHYFGGLALDEAAGEGYGEGEDEEADVAGDDFGVDVHAEVAASAPGEDEVGGAGDEHGDGGEHEGRADDGADAHVVGVGGVFGGGGAGEDGHDGDEGFGQGGAHGGEDAAEHAFVETEFLAEPFDAVGENVAAGQDDDQAEDQHQPREPYTHASLRFSLGKWGYCPAGFAARQFSVSWVGWGHQAGRGTPVGAA